MYNVVSIILGIVTTIFSGYCLVVYYDSFMERRSWSGRGRKFLLIAAFVVANYVLDYCFEGGYETGKTIGKLLLLLAVVFFLAKTFYHAEIQMVLFLAVTFTAIRDLCDFISMLVSVCGGKLSVI